MKTRFSTALAAAVLLGYGATANTEDIDLFVGTQSSANALPNVLFVIDNTANWNQAFANEMSALANTFEELPLNEDGTARFNVGIMLANETGSPNNNISGGYVRAAFRPMTQENKDKYADLIRSLDKLGDKGNGGYSAITLAEAYYYFSGGTPYAGNNKVKTDYAGNVYGTAASKAIYALGDNALSAFDGTRYNSTAAASCAKNYIIYISNGPNQENASADDLANARLTAAGGNAEQIALSPTGSQKNPSDEWARFMATSPLGIVTYTIDVNPVTKGQGPGWTALLRSMSIQSKGEYAAVDSSDGSGKQIQEAINKALSKIQDVNSVFAAVSLPLSANTQGSYLNQVYIGMFRPDVEARPRWAGNLKQYKMGLIDGVLALQDADDNDAINSLTGFVAGCSRSFWTPTTVDDKWAFNPQGTCAPTPPNSTLEEQYKASNFPDGNVVEKGGQGYTLRELAAPPALTTCSPTLASCTDLTKFDATNTDISAALLGVSDTERTALINWARGLDLDDENLSKSITDIRPSIHGDVVHSRPVAVNFGDVASPKVMVFYGSNDGVLRAINGGRTGSIGSVGAGGQLWGFVPPEFYGKLKRVRDNDVLVSYPNITDTTALPKPYGIDGPIVAYQNGASAWIYASMRRGGRAIYAFDVDASDTDPTFELKWKRGCDTSGCSTDFDGIGQTWSAPKVLKAAGHGAGATPLLIVGGGYDPCEDVNPNTCTASTKGNQVYVMDADTGDLLKTFSTDRAVIADVVVVPNPSTGLALYAYAVDLGGNVYRIDIGTKDTADWTMTKIASLGCDSTSTCTLNRKFMFAPDVVLEGGTYMLLLGSGDREKPRNYTNTVNNYFFMIKDRPADGTWLSSESGTCGSAIICLDSLVPILDANNPSNEDLAAKKGWYLGLLQAEQVVTPALTIFGTVTFSTHKPDIPTPGECSANLGTARAYNISYVNAASQNGTKDRSAKLPSLIGLPPPPVGGVVTTDDGKTLPFLFGGDAASPIKPTEPKTPATTVPAQPKSRVYWYIQR